MGDDIVNGNDSIQHRVGYRSSNSSTDIDIKHNKSQKRNSHIHYHKNQQIDISSSDSSHDDGNSVGMDQSDHNLKIKLTKPKNEVIKHKKKRKRSSHSSDKSRHSTSDNRLTPNLKINKGYKTYKNGIHRNVLSPKSPLSANTMSVSPLSATPMSVSTIPLKKTVSQSVSNPDPHEGTAMDDVRSIDSSEMNLKCKSINEKCIDDSLPSMEKVPEPSHSNNSSSEHNDPFLPPKQFEKMMKEYAALSRTQPHSTQFVAMQQQLLFIQQQHQLSKQQKR